VFGQPSEMQAPSGGIARSLTLAALGSIVLRHWLLVVIVAVITAIVCRQVLSSRDPMYRAQASVYFTPGGDPGDTRGPDIGYLNTQRDQMLSMPRLEKVVRLFDLEEQKPYRSVADPPALLAQRLSALTDKDTWVVKLELVDEFPERGQRLLDHLITDYAGSLEDRNRSRRDRERVYWQDRAQHLRGELRDRSQEINSFKRDARIISTDPAANRFTRLLYISRVQWQTLSDEIAERRGLLEQIEGLVAEAMASDSR
jgi:uncharacterized protein involved in exopolysaccharide biosynthesis